MKKRLDNNNNLYLTLCSIYSTKAIGGRANIREAIHGHAVLKVAKWRTKKTKTTEKEIVVP